MKQLYEFLIKNRSTGIIKDNEFVDLGLSVLWAKCNIGAKEPEDCGHYFMFGSTKPNDNTDCSWENTPFYNQKTNLFNPHSAVNWDKYNKQGDILKHEDDAAHVILGGSCRMPTIDDCNELCEKTFYEWIQINEIFGCKFTANNGNYIFIPAAGRRVYTTFKSKNKYADLWTSNMTDYCNCAHSFYFDEERLSPKDADDRYYGLSIRAVKNK